MFIKFTTTVVNYIIYCPLIYIRVKYYNITKKFKTN